MMNGKTIMDNFLDLLKQGRVELNIEKAKPTHLRTTAEMRKILGMKDQKPRGRKAKQIEIDGEYRTLREWAKFLGLPYDKLYYQYAKQGLRGRALINKVKELI